jgi:hypothetical protein
MRWHLEACRLHTYVGIWVSFWIGTGSWLLRSALSSGPGVFMDVCFCAFRLHVLIVESLPTHFAGHRTCTACMSHLVCVCVCMCCVMCSFAWYRACVETAPGHVCELSFAHLLGLGHLHVHSNLGRCLRSYSHGCVFGTACICPRLFPVAFAQGVHRRACQRVGGEM